jgi:hypothetical protein
MIRLLISQRYSVVHSHLAVHTTITTIDSRARADRDSSQVKQPVPGQGSGAIDLSSTVTVCSAIQGKYLPTMPMRPPLDNRPVRSRARNGSATREDMAVRDRRQSRAVLGVERRAA